MSEYKIVENQLIVENFVKDVIIKSEFRGKGIGKMLKLTLKILSSVRLNLAGGLVWN